MQNNYVIFTDSTSDLFEKKAKELNVKLIPLGFTLDGERTFLDGEISQKEFYDSLRAGSVSKSTQISKEKFVDAFEPVLQEGKDILYIGFSSALSGTFSKSTLAKEELEQIYPDRKILLVDSVAAALGEGLLVIYAAQKRDEGLAIEELAKNLEENKLRVAHYFTVDDLQHLKRGGRISGTTAVMGTMLGIKPVLRVNNAGELVPYKKIRGRKQSLQCLVEEINNRRAQQSGDLVIVAHADAFDDAMFVKDSIEAKMDVKEVMIGQIGTVIGSHAGPGTIAVFFWANER